VWLLEDGGELECLKCRHFSGKDDDDDLTSRIGTAACPACGCEGFIHHRSDHKIFDRFPDQLGQQFVPLYSSTAMSSA
jgi:hypothetical protein